MARGAGGADPTGTGVGDADGSLPEVVGNAAILVDPTDVEQIVDAMRLVLTQQALAAELRARGLARAAQFTWQRTADGGRRSAVGGGAIDRLARGGYNVLTGHHNCAG